MTKGKIAIIALTLVCGTAIPVQATEVLVGIADENRGNMAASKTETEAVQNAEKETEPVRVEKNGWKVAIDPGHQGNWVDMSALEPSAPGSSEMKAKATTGTTGRYSGLNEFELNLDVSLVLRDELEERGYEVVMTREDHDKAISNKERAELAAEEGADILVRIHANGSDNEGVHGALTMVPSKENAYVGYMFDDCYELGKDILEEYCLATGFDNLDVGFYDDMSGINWSTIPVTILEMGFMSNPDDDLQMAEESFWPVMADGIANGIDLYFEERKPEIVEDVSGTETESETEADKKENKALLALHDELEESVAMKGNASENWSVAVVDLKTDGICKIYDQSMQAASLIKLYICGAVYEKYQDLIEAYGTEQIDGLLFDMITVSDNTAANTLTNYLGNGDDASGREEVTAYCARNGYENTVMGRMLLASKETGDNMTSVCDCCEFLTKVYHNEIPHAEEIQELLRKQQRTHKIPSGLPEGVICGNKTGELDTVENDAAIVYAEKPYILCIMSEYLSDVYDAQVDISNISREVYAFTQQEF